MIGEFQLIFLFFPTFIVIYIKLINFGYVFIRFYLFACANCNHGVEFLRRLHMNMEDVVHLLLFNLTLHFSKRYYNLTNVLFPYARDNWPALQLPPKVISIVNMVFDEEMINNNSLMNIQCIDDLN